ncbi:MAG: FkbM family methyltransferase [Sphingomicrobium sp.]
MIPLRWRVVRALGPILSRLSPFLQVRVYGRLSGDPFAAGVFHERVIRSIAPHGFQMELDLRDWMDRYAAINGCYYEAESTALLQRVLVPGATFVDIGGNIGFLTLTAAGLVGPSGKVIYVEPNADLVARLRETLARNELEHVEVHSVALAEQAGEAALHMGSSHGVTQVVPGAGTIKRTGDELLEATLGSAPALIKIDVEGYEERVLSGMASTLARRDTAFYVEVTDAWLRQNGGSAAALFDKMTVAGFDAWTCRQMRGGMRLEPLGGSVPLSQVNVLFARPGSFGAP